MDRSNGYLAKFLQILEIVGVVENLFKCLTVTTKDRRKPRERFLESRGIAKTIGALDEGRADPANRCGRKRLSLSLNAYRFGESHQRNPF